MNQAFARHSLAACIKGGLELQSFLMGAPLPSQSSLSKAGEDELGLLLAQMD